MRWKSAVLLCLLICLPLVAAQDDEVPPYGITPENARLLVEGAALVGHETAVNDIAFSPDGTLLASVGDDLSLRLWRIETTDQPTAVYGHTGRIGSVAFSPQRPPPEGDTTERYLLISGAWDRTAILYEIAIESGAVSAQQQLEQYAAIVEPVTFSLTGHLLALGIGEGVVQIRRTATLDIQHTLILDGLRVTALDFSPDDRLLVTAAGFPADNAQVWRLGVDDAQPVDELSGHAGAVTALDFSPHIDAERAYLVASAGDDGTLRLWRVAQAGETSPLAVIAPEGETWFTDVTFSPDGALLAASTLDGEIMLWDARQPEAPQALITLTGHDGPVNAIAFSPPSQEAQPTRLFLASAGQDGTIRLWIVP
jgi:WD40 repeat protein